MQFPTVPGARSDVPPPSRPRVLRGPSQLRLPARFPLFPAAACASCRSHRGARLAVSRPVRVHIWPPCPSLHTMVCVCPPGGLVHFHPRCSWVCSRHFPLACHACRLRCPLRKGPSLPRSTSAAGKELRSAGRAWAGRQRSFAGRCSLFGPSSLPRAGSLCQWDPCSLSALFLPRPFAGLPQCLSSHHMALPGTSRL